MPMFSLHSLFDRLGKLLRVKEPGKALQKAPRLEDALILARSTGSQAVDAIPLLAPALGYQQGDMNLVYPAEVMDPLHAALDELIQRMTPGDYIRDDQRLRATQDTWIGEPLRCWSRLTVEHIPDIVTGTPTTSRG
jgi:hypothetical protein